MDQLSIYGLLDVFLQNAFHSQISIVNMDQEKFKKESCSLVQAASLFRHAGTQIEMVTRLLKLVKMTNLYRYLIKWGHNPYRIYLSFQTKPQ